MPREVTWWPEFRDLAVLQLLAWGSQPSTVTIRIFYTNTGEPVPLGKYSLKRDFTGRELGSALLRKVQEGEVQS